MNTSITTPHTPLIVRVGESHVKVRVDGVEWIPHEKDDPLPLELSEAFPLREVRFNHPNALVHHALPLSIQYSK